MITVGEIKRIFTDINNTVVCDVDISLFRTTLNKYNENDRLIGSIYTSTISTLPGIYMPYKIGDIVYIGFVNNEISNPVILGLVHKNLPKEGDSSSYAYFQDLKVSDNVELPVNTSIGDITYRDIKSNILNTNKALDEINSILGVWNDGKIIYKISGTSLISSSSVVEEIIDILNVDKIIKIECVIDNGNYSSNEYDLVLDNGVITPVNKVIMYYDNSSHKLKVKLEPLSSYTTRNLNIYYRVEYTKTS